MLSTLWKFLVIATGGLDVSEQIKLRIEASLLSCQNPMTSSPLSSCWWQAYNPYQAQHSNVVTFLTHWVFTVELSLRMLINQTLHHISKYHSPFYFFCVPQELKKILFFSFSTIQKEVYCLYKNIFFILSGLVIFIIWKTPSDQFPPSRVLSTHTSFHLYYLSK